MSRKFNKSFVIILVIFHDNKARDEIVKTLLPASVCIKI